MSESELAMRDVWATVSGALAIIGVVFMLDFVGARRDIMPTLKAPKATTLNEGHVPGGEGPPYEDVLN